MTEKFSENGLIIPENLMKKECDAELVAVACSQMFINHVLWEKESSFHSISVCENQVGRFINYGISFQAGIVNSSEYKGNIPYLNYFLIPYLLKPKARKILVIGFGTGFLIKQIEQLFDNLIQIDAVDIEENILHIATNFFNFEKSDKFNFNLQDALVFLRENKTKYDYIIVDVAGNVGVDARFFEDDFFQNIKKSLNKNGIFAFNSCANTDYDESDNSFYGFTVSQYKKYFNNFAVFDGKTSDEIYFRVFYGIDKRILDVSNVIFIASDNENYFDMNHFSHPNKNRVNKILNIEV
ncbi:methyltransferase domain-containing protein, partial [bacterium]|nr:methyltransferase domain-containing protein [bacterium]